MNGFAELNEMKALADDFIVQAFDFINRQKDYQELNRKEDVL